MVRGLKEKEKKNSTGKTNTYSSIHAINISPLFITTGTYSFIQESGFVPYKTCLEYEACSQESTEGHCGAEGADFTCSAINTCRTCSTFLSNGGFCAGIDQFPNATVAEFGTVSGEDEIMAELYARG